MFKVLMPVDGSSSSLNAIEKALLFGITEDVEMHVITVVTPINTTPSKNPYIPNDLVEDVRRAHHLAANDILEAAKAKICELNASCNIHLIREGDAAEEILRYADEIEADLIVVGSRGLSTFGKLLVGSVSQKVINNANCSVLVVRDRK